MYYINLISYLFCKKKSCRDDVELFNILEITTKY